MKFQRITLKPEQMDGLPCIRGLRIPVATVVDMLASGMSNQDILSAYPDLEADDIREALQFAASAVRERQLPLVARPHMQDTFSHTGYWWLPEYPDKQVPGTLRYDPENGAILELMGVLGKEHSFDEAFDTAPVVSGAINEWPYDATLWGTIRTNHSISGSYHRSQYKANKVFIGAKFSSEEEIKFYGLTASYSNLEQWVNRQPFTQSSMQNNILLLNVSFNQVDKEARLGDFVVSIWDTIHQSHSIGELTGIHQAKVSIRFDTLVRFDEIFEVLECVKGFIAIGIGKPVQTISLNGMVQDQNPFPVRIYGLFRDRHLSVKTVHYHRMIFTVEDLGDEFEDVLQKWFSSWDKIKPVYQLYFALLDMPIIHIEAQFLLLVQALEAFHRLKQGGHYMKNSEYEQSVSNPLTSTISELKVSKDFREKLLGSVQYLNEYSLNKRLKEMLKYLKMNFKDQLEQLQVNKDFLNRIKDTRNELTHLNNINVFSDVKIDINDIRKLRLLLLMCFLEEIGLCERLDSKIIEKSEDYKLATGQRWL